MAKIAILTDTHFGARNSSPIFRKFFQRFYDEVFFPTIDKLGITTIAHLGDVVDRRKYIGYQDLRTLDVAFMQPIARRGITLHAIVGNHDVTFKNTNELNSLESLYGKHKYPNFNFYSSPKTIDIHGTSVLMMPWICSGNFDESMAAIRKTQAKAMFAHLEIVGFEMYRGAMNYHGFEPNVFDKFDQVLTGHFHKKSRAGNIDYLGAPYQMTWSDFNDKRGFHLWDSDTLELTYIENPFEIFHKVFYSDEGLRVADVMEMDFSVYNETFVKIIVEKKTNPYLFDMFVQRLQDAGPIHIQVLDEQIQTVDSDGDLLDHTEDTLTIIKQYVTMTDIPVSKDRTLALLTELYNEAVHLE